ncbi:MAG: N-acetylneuraminate synthase [Desulfobulbaceae bacterium]|nr:N-acetylneuraminate synthase [Desulfobulbaceae bacterium]
MKRPIYIIAEAGVNHNGSLEIAKKMIVAAAEAEVDAVKFQTFRAEAIACGYATKAVYQRKTTDSGESQLEMLEKLELDRNAHEDLQLFCTEYQLQFLSSPFDIDSITLLYDMGLRIFKIPSGEITNLPYLRKIGSLKCKVLLSTGMSELAEVEQAIKVLTINGTKKSDIVVLHCNTEYPTPMQDVNLRAMLTMAEQFEVEVGYSDHTSGIEMPIAAAALGATVIEKHFTLDRTMVGPDHEASLEPDELKEMVRAVRNIEKGLGNGEKRPRPSELRNREIVRKSIVAAKPIWQGELYGEDNLTAKRPALGLSPMRWDELIGHPANRDYQTDECIDPIEHL